MTYLPFVDGLRAIAIAAVVVFHAFPSALPGGFIGVDVFFVISGFLITRFIAATMAERTFSLVQFYVRRARRLLPAALVCFAAVTVLAGFILLPDAYLYHGRSLLGSLFMYANIFFYRTGGYFSAPALEKPLLHTWSLAVEDQFYLTWPLLLVLLLPRLSKQVLMAVLALLIAASLSYAQVQVLRDSEFAFFMLPARAWELLLGAVVALNGDHAKRMPRRFAEVCAAGGLAAILASAVLLSPAATFPGLSAVPPCFGTAALIAGGLSGHSYIARGLAWRPFVLTGLMSYSLYLWHWPLIAIASYQLERPLTPVEAAGIVALSIVLAYLSWRFVERPFRKHREGVATPERARSDRRFVFGAVTGVILVAALSGVIKITKGLPERYASGVRHALDQMVTSNPWRQSCDNYDKIFSNDAVCNFGRKKARQESYEIAMFGDSMADHWVPLVAEAAEKQNLAGRQTTNGGCVFLVGVEIPAEPAAKARECANYQKEAIRFIEANPKLKTAVVSAFWEKWIKRLDDGAEQSPQLGSSQKVIAATLAFFTKRGIRVLLIGQIPTYVHLPVRCIAAKVTAGLDPGACGLTASEAQNELSRSNAVLRSVAAADPMVSLFLPSDVMCNAERCPPMTGNTMLYKNEGHLNRFGALYLGRYVTFPKPD